MTPRLTTRLALSVAVMCAGTVVLPAHATDTGKTSGATAAKPAAPVVKVSAKDLLEFKKVIAPLLKEGAEAFAPKDPKAPGKLREKSDFFAGGKLPEGITTDIVLAGLKEQQSPDPRVDAYVKWQVLSAVPIPVPDEMLSRFVEAYKAAPKPINHPGLDHAGFQNLLNKAGTNNRKAIEPMNAELDKMSEQYEANNATIMTYRNEMVARLPTNATTVLAEVEDLYYRAQAAAESKQMFDRLREKLKNWALTAKPAELNQVIPGVVKVGEMVKSDKYKAYYRVVWMEDTKSKKSGLQFEGRAAFEPKYYDNFVTDLKDAARGGNPALTGNGENMQKKKG